MVGVGYRAELQGANLVLSVGYSQPVTVEPMEGIAFEVGQETNNRMPFICRARHQQGSPGAAGC